MNNNNNNVAVIANNANVSGSLKAGELKTDEIISGSIYWKVVTPGARTTIVKNAQGLHMEVDNGIMCKEMTSSVQFDETKKVNRSDMVSVMISAKDVAFSARFRKQIKKKDVVSKIKGAIDGKMTTKKQLAAVAKQCLEGEVRNIVARLKYTEPHLGRSQVIDLNIENQDANERQIDHRTLEELVLNRIKYIL